MDVRELGRLDLNLLVALQVLLEERNVTLAAQRLHITQSAMSKTLGRLRELFDDPLFIRKASGMMPTLRAEQIARQLPQILHAVNSIVQPTLFDPSSYRGEFTLLMQGHTGVWAMPRLMERMRKRAPGIHLRCITHAENLFQKMASGEIDFALQAERQTYPAEIQLNTLGFAPPVILARAEHPLAKEEITWEKLMQYPQISLLLSEVSETHFIADANSLFMHFEREFTPHLETDNLVIAVQTLLRSDCIFPAPPLFLEQDELAKGLIALPLPAGEKVQFKYVLARHDRISNSHPHLFLMGEILAATDDFRHQYGLPSLAEMRKNRNLAY